MTERPLALLATIAAACGPSGDPLDVRYRLHHGDENRCELPDGDLAMSCDDIPMSCVSVVMLRIVNPDPNEPERYVEECLRIPDTDSLETLCALNRVAFTGEGRMPTDRVEVQLAIFARKQLDPRGTAEAELMPPICPADVEFTATGFAHVSNDPQPALSGRAYAEGDDREVIIELGCHDLKLINDCNQENVVDITTSVIDIETQLSVSGGKNGTATRLLVAAGEPYASGVEWIFDTTSSTPLALDNEGTVPFWFGPDIEVGTLDGEIPFADTACIEVLETLPGRTASIICYKPMQPLPNDLDLGGVLVRKPTLDLVLGALGLTEFPSDCSTGNCGLVLGIVVDDVGQAVPGVVVEDSTAPLPSEVLYLSEDRTTTAGITATTTSGMFISRTAQFFTPEGPNTWTVTPAPGGPQIDPLNTPVGGIISNRLTVLVFQVRVPK